MSTERNLIDRLGEPFPPQALKTRVGGGNSRFTYIEGFTVIHRLNAATGGTWDWHIKSFEFRPLPPLTDRKTGELKEQSLVVVTGELTIPGLGTRAGIGVQKVSENGGEDLVKGASTDALKKAATLFGVALELYGPDYEETAQQQTAPARQPRASASPPPTPRPAAAPPGGGPPPTSLAEIEAALAPLAKQVRTNDDALSNEEYARYHALEAAREQAWTATLATIRDDEADPKARKKALHDLYGGAQTVADLNRRAELVKASGLPGEDRDKAFRWHHERLSQQLAVAAK